MWRGKKRKKNKAPISVTSQLCCSAHHLQAMASRQVVSMTLYTSVQPVYRSAYRLKGAPERREHHRPQQKEWNNRPIAIYSLVWKKKQCTRALSLCLHHNRARTARGLCMYHHKQGWHVQQNACCFTCQPFSVLRWQKVKQHGSLHHHHPPPNHPWGAQIEKQKKLHVLNK